MRGFGIFLIIALILAAAIDLFIVVFVKDEDFPGCDHTDWPLERDRKGMFVSLFGKLIVLTYIWMTLPQE